MTLTTWDTRVAARALVLGALAFAVAWLVTATTDEGGVAWGVRAGRTLPIAPVCAALGTAIALAHLRARGEVRALEALGRAPWENALAAVCGGGATARGGRASDAARRRARSASSPSRRSRRSCRFTPRRSAAFLRSWRRCRRRCCSRSRSSAIVVTHGWAREKRSDGVVGRRRRRVVR